MASVNCMVLLSRGSPGLDDVLKAGSEETYLLQNAFSPRDVQQKRGRRRKIGDALQAPRSSSVRKLRRSVPLTRETSFRRLPASGVAKDSAPAFQSSSPTDTETDTYRFQSSALETAQNSKEIRPYWPELPNPFSARAESSRLSTSSTVPVKTGTGIIWAIFSPAFSSTDASVRLVISTRISPR